MDNYLKQVIEQVKAETNKDIFTSGLKVYTNIIPEAQKDFMTFTILRTMCITLMLTFRLPQPLLMSQMDTLSPN